MASSDEESAAVVPRAAGSGRSVSVESVDGDSESSDVASLDTATAALLGGGQKYVQIGPLRLKEELYFMLVLSTISAFLFADQNLLSPVLSRVAQDLGFVEKFPNGTVIYEFDDRLGYETPKVDAAARDKYVAGYVTLAFFLIGGVASLFVGYLADTVNRKWSIAVIVCLGEAFCIATFWVETYGELLFTRSMSGVALGGFIPLFFSLTDDLYSIENRGKAIAAASIAMGVGAGGGQVMAGLVAGEDRANWRTSFLIVGTPTYFLVALLLLTVREPARGSTEALVKAQQQEVLKEMRRSVRASIRASVDFTSLQQPEDAQRSENLAAKGGAVDLGSKPPSPIITADDVDELQAAVYDEKVTWVKVRQLFKTPTATLIFFTGILGSLPWGVILGFVQDFLIVEKGVSVALSGIVVLAFGAGAIVGGMFGGYAADKLYKRQPWIPIMIGSTTALGTIPMWTLINLPPQHVAVYCTLMVPAGFVASISGAAVRAMLINTTLPEVRGTAFSVLNLCDDLGKGGGVFLVSLIIGAAGSRTKGINYAMSGWIVAGMALYTSACFIQADFDRMQRRLEAQVKTPAVTLNEKV